jgi:uncharacterized protein (DUF2267 family)
MSATGLDVFDKTLQTTNIWLSQIMDAIGVDRRLAWHVLGATLRVLRDRLGPGLAAHLGAQLPLLVRGLYYDQWSPQEKPSKLRSADEFLEEVARAIGDVRPINVQKAVQAVFATIAEHIESGQVEKVRDALPRSVRDLWPTGGDHQPSASEIAAQVGPPDFPK